MKWITLIILTIFLFPGCDLREREQALDKREAQVNQKEQELLLKEKTLQLKEEELLKREQKLDSNVNDSAFIYDPRIIGIWSVKMTCTETTCTGSAVGDTKTEQWEISYQNNHIIAKVISGDQLVRTYSGIYTGNTVELVEYREGTVAQPATKMVVRLRITSNSTMEGQREIVREDCKIIYALQMSKQQ